MPDFFPINLWLFSGDLVSYDPRFSPPICAYFLVTSCPMTLDFPTNLCLFSGDIVSYDPGFSPPICAYFLVTSCPITPDFFPLICTYFPVWSLVLQG